MLKFSAELQPRNEILKSKLKSMSVRYQRRLTHWI